MGLSGAWKSSDKMYQKIENGTYHLLPYDKFMNCGPEGMTEEELIAIILRTGTQGEDALNLACRVFELCGSKHGILGLYHLSIKDLMQIKGIGEVKAVKLKAIAELSRRMAKAKCQEDILFRSPNMVAAAYMEQMRHYEKEHCIVIYLDGKDERISDHLLSIGDINCALIPIRELFRQAIQVNAASFILLHNHPSGNPEPSEDDIFVTKKVKEASLFMEVPLLDHIIIGDNTYTSFREKGVL